MQVIIRTSFNTLILNSESDCNKFLRWLISDMAEIELNVFIAEEELNRCWVVNRNDLDVVTIEGAFKCK